MRRLSDHDHFAALRQRVTNQLGVSDLSWTALDELPVRPVVAETRDTLYRQGDEIGDMFVLSHGWALGCSNLRDGKRYVHRIYQAGDLIGTEDTNWNYGTSTVQTVTPCRLARFSKDRQYELFAQNPRLGSALFGLAMNDQVVVMDAARVNARLPARGRLIHLLLQIEARTRLSDGGGEGEPFHLPLTQVDIADATGLTNVYVSRALSALVREGSLARRGTTYQLLERDALVQQIGFVNRYRVTMGNWNRQLVA